MWLLMEYQLGKWLERITEGLKQVMATNAEILEKIRALPAKIQEVHDDITKLAARIPGAEDPAERQQIATELDELGRTLDAAGALTEDGQVVTGVATDGDVVEPSAPSGGGLPVNAGTDGEAPSTDHPFGGNQEPTDGGVISGSVEGQASNGQGVPDAEAPDATSTSGLAPGDPRNRRGTPAA